MAKRKSQTASKTTVSTETASVKSADGADVSDGPYVVLARKYRPQTFEDLIGQQAMVTTLKNAFATDRIAQGYMLTGVRGVGKTTTARILARALNYSIPGEIDRPTIDMGQIGGQIGGKLGEHCSQIMESRHPDVLEMDAASNTGIDNIREIIESARYKPMVARYKVYIIDEVHMLSKGAFNALLKTLEEPPSHVKFIFATTEIRKVPVTVLSRCQRFDLRRVDVPALSAHFKWITANEGARAQDDALTLIARAAEGSVRDGLSILDQAIAVNLGERAQNDNGKAQEITVDAVRTMLGLADRGRIFDLLEYVLGGAASEALQALSSLHHDGAEAAQVLSDLAEAVHVTTRLKMTVADATGQSISGEEKRRASALAEKLSIALLSRAWQMLLKGLDEVAGAPNPLAAAEMVLIRLAYTADLPTPEEIIRTIGNAAPTNLTQASAPGAPATGTTSGSSTGQALHSPGAQTIRASSSATTPAARPPWDDATVGADHGNAQRVPPSTTPPGRTPDDVTPAGKTPQAPLETSRHMPPDSQGQSPTVGQNSGVPQSFEDVIALAGRHREAKLVYQLEEQVSLVQFEPNKIELYLLPGAPKELANDLREKLNSWTGLNWILALSNRPGAPAIGQAKRDIQTARIDAVKAHPGVRAILDEFPDAQISKVTDPPDESQEDSAQQDRGRNDDSATG